VIVDGTNSSQDGNRYFLARSSACAGWDLDGSVWGGYKSGLVGWRREM